MKICKLLVKMYNIEYDILCLGCRVFKWHYWIFVEKENSEKIYQQVNLLNIKLTGLLLTLILFI